MFSSRLFATLGFLLASTAASADFTGFSAVKSRVEGSEGSYRVIQVYATFNNPTDRVFNVFDAEISLSGSATPRFLQAEDKELETFASFLPLLFTPNTERWFVDSYITIGAEQDTMSNGTIADPDFSESGAGDGLGVEGGGWYNLPPTNNHGLAGDDLRVLVGQFAIDEAEFTADARLHFSATVGYSDLGVVAFASQSALFSFALPGTDEAPYVIDDLDGDSRSDVVFVHPTSNQLFGWLVNGLSLKQYALFNAGAPAGSTLQGIGDADGNGKTDVLWRSNSTGRFAIGALDGLQYLSTTIFAHNPGNTWKALAFTDVDGDRKADILFYNEERAQIAVWLLDGPSIRQGAVLGTFAGAKPLAVGDLDGDRRRDILWRRSDGQVWGWLLDGTAAPTAARIGNVASTIGPSWIAPIIADLDGDGNDDVVWRSLTSGMVVAWKMNGLAMESFRVMQASTSSAWSIEGAPDVDGDGRREILWRNRVTGSTLVWTTDPLASFATHSSTGFTPASGAWKIATPAELVRN